MDDRVQDQILKCATLPSCPQRNRVVHRQQDPSTAKDGLSWVCTIFTVLSNLPSPSRAKALAHHDAARSRQGVQGEQAQTWGAVQHNEVVVVANLFKG